MSPALTLYHFAPSAHSRAALWTLRYLDIDVDVKTVNLFEKEQLQADFVALNPQHCVPTLTDGNAGDADRLVLWESRAIATYVAEQYRPEHAAWPQGDTKLRARISQRLYFDLGTLYTRIRAICFPIIFLGETRIPADKRDALIEALGWLSGFLADGNYVAGTAEPTLADIFTMASISSIKYAGLDITAYPLISAWYERCSKLPGFEENDAGARQFGARITAKLEDTFQ